MLQLIKIKSTSKGETPTIIYSNKHLIKQKKTQFSPPSCKLSEHGNPIQHFRHQNKDKGKKLTSNVGMERSKKTRNHINPPPPPKKHTKLMMPKTKHTKQHTKAAKRGEEGGCYCGGVRVRGEENVRFRDEVC